MDSIRPMIVVHDVSSDEVVERPMTDEEWEQRRQDEVSAAEFAAAQSAAKEALDAKLAALGLSADELRVILT